MEVTGTHLTVAQFCEGLENGSIVIDRKYQRQPGVWPAAAQSFLVETILLGFPVPKLALHVTTDRETRRTKSEIVDGQQRATAINGFLKGEFRLARTLEIEEARGQSYESLPPDLQQRFLSYSLGIDQLVNVGEDEIREIFRRINSYEVPLNPEEQRHAKHQGPFKWFIYRIAREYGDLLKETGTFTERNLIRMLDMKLLAEVCHALVHGISTTTKRSLDKLYGDLDKDFENEDTFGVWLEEAFAVLASIYEVHNTDLMKHFSVYSLVLASIHARHNLEELADLGEGGRGVKDRGELVQALTDLLIPLEEDGDPDDGYEPFRRAFERGTNVAEQRRVRAQYFLEALAPE